MVPVREPEPLDRPDPPLAALTVTARRLEHFTVAFVVMVKGCAPAAEGSMLMLMTPFTACPHCDCTVPLTDTVGAGVTVAAITTPVMKRPLNAMTACAARYFFFEKTIVRSPLQTMQTYICDITVIISIGNLNMLCNITTLLLFVKRLIQIN